MAQEFMTMTSQGYTSLWNKYRPALVQLMVAAENTPQEYKFYEHEFKALNPKVKGGYGFQLEAFKGKAVNSIKNNIQAQDLLKVLTTSKKASDLMDQNHFEFAMDKKFVLRVKKIAVETEETDDLQETDAEMTNTDKA